LCFLCGGEKQVSHIRGTECVQPALVNKGRWLGGAWCLPQPLLLWLLLRLVWLVWLLLDKPI
jgi:hypothetical protein